MKKENNKFNRIENVDAFDLLDQIQSDTVDLIILDPNYQDWSDMIERGLVAHALRIIKSTGSILCFTKQPFDFHLRNEIDSHFRREIVWTFTNGGAWVSERMPLVSHQKIYHCVKSGDSYFNKRTGLSYSEQTKSFKRGKKVFGGYEEEGRKFEPSDEGVWLRDHLHFNKPNTGSIPSKPQDLYDILIKCYCPNGGLVVEPFSGSGNFAKSCIDQGKSYLGSEIDKSVWDYSLRQIQNYTPLLQNLEIK